MIMQAIYSPKTLLSRGKQYKFKNFYRMHKNEYMQNIMHKTHEI